MPGRRHRTPAPDRSRRDARSPETRIIGEWRTARPMEAMTYVDGGRNSPGLRYEPVQPVIMLEEHRRLTFAPVVAVSTWQASAVPASCHHSPQTTRASPPSTQRSSSHLSQKVHLRQASR